MYNAHGWINLRISPKASELETINTISIQYDEIEEKLYEEFIEKIKLELERIKKENLFIKYEIINFNNFSNFLTIQYSRNHKSNILKDFYSFVAKLNDGSHGLLYEIDDENDFNEHKPYKIYRLLGNEFKEIEETNFNNQLGNIETF